MKLVDLNLLLYAVNEDAPHHREALSWWQECLSGDEEIGLAWSVLLGFLRVSTLPLMPAPLSCETALEVVEDWLAQPQVIVVSPSARHWSILRDLLQASGTAGNLTSDAHLAALAIEYDAVLCSTDHDFRRFEPDLKLLYPLVRKRR